MTVSTVTWRIAAGFYVAAAQAARGATDQVTLAGVHALGAQAPAVGVRQRRDAQVAHGRAAVGGVHPLAGEGRPVAGVAAGNAAAERPDGASEEHCGEVGH